MTVIDGFAGPGIYDDGSDGSPIIALRAFLDQKVAIRAASHFHFIEKDVARAERLRACVKDLFSIRAQPNNLHVNIHSGKDFATAYAEVTRGLPKSAPCFAFVDPFGFGRIPMSIMKDLMDRDSGEVLVNFMFEEIYRFLTQPDQGPNFDRLFGCTEWEQVAKLPTVKRRAGIRDLYAKQLKTIAGARFVRHFEMRNARSSTDYYLFFATKRVEGLKKMKDSMWKVDQTGGLTFSDATDPGQGIMFGSEDRAQLRAALLGKFRRQEVRVEAIEAFVVEETAFRETYYKGLLKEWEVGTPAQIQVTSAKDGRKRGTFPAGTMVRFL